MLVDLNSEFDNEVLYLHRDLLANKGFDFIDYGEIIGLKTPFQVTDGVNELVYYITVAPGIEVLNYIDQSHNEVFIPWISFEFGIRDDLNEDERDEILKWFRDEIKKCEGYQPFEDEDGNHLIFTKGRHKSNFGEYQYKFFMNTHYPKGYWHNHTIDCIDL